MITLLQEMLASGGKREFRSNVMVMFREKTVIPLPRHGFVNPLYGNADKSRMLDNELDERAYDRTILRHSTFFDRMRKIRMNVNASGPYILGESAVYDVPDYRTRQVYCGGFLDTVEKDGVVHKWLCIPGEGVFEFYGDGLVKMMFTTPVTPYVTLQNGTTTCTTVSPLTDKLTAFGKMGTRMCRSYTAENVYDDITLEGGRASFSYSSSMYGVGMEHVEISIDVFPLPKEHQEVFTFGDDGVLVQVSEKEEYEL